MGMHGLVSNSFRILCISDLLYFFVKYKALIFPLDISIFFCFFPWLAYEILRSNYPKNGKSPELPGLILETMGMISSVVLLNNYIFSSFIIIVFFQFIQFYQIRKGFIINLLISMILITCLIVFKSDLEVLIMFPAFHLLSILIYRAIKENEAEMRSEIDDQQTQIDGKNKLLSTLSHELRTPLMVIKTSTEIILEERPGVINSTQKRFLKSTLDNTMRMVHFVDTILASIKVEYAWFRMKKEPIDLRNSIKRVCTDMQNFISSKDQELIYTYPNLLSKPIADENWIQQVLINLVYNASKHIGKNGKIVISVTENEQCIVVSVSDDGSGIINQDKSRIFSEFYQGEGSDGSNMDGVGLGLSIVKNVIEKHDGKVYVGSVAGLGTTLSFTLPKEDEAY